MQTFMKDGVKIVMPDYDAASRRNMMRAAEFMARMVQKYGKEVLAEIEAEEKAKAELEARQECPFKTSC